MKPEPGLKEGDKQESGWDTLKKHFIDAQKIYLENVEEVK